MNLKFLTLLSFFIVYFVGNNCDIPVHCLYDQYEGMWVYQLSSNNFNNSINCSAPIEFATQYKIKLLYPNIVVDQYGNSGYWTRIYDEGVEVVIANRKFFAFSKYVINNGVAVSVCNETFPGWYHGVDGKNWGCFFGYRVTSSKTTELFETEIKNSLNEDKIWKAENHMIENINSNPTNSWTATSYENIFKDKTIKQFKRMMGSSKSFNNGEIPKFAEVKESKQYKTKIEDLPANFDWRNVNGANYVSPVRDQGACGSCYTFATTAMLEARMRILSQNSVQTILSTQKVVSCSEYSQGCDGGFEYLVSKYGEDFGLINENCFPYQSGSGQTIPCSYCQNAKLYNVTDYYYIGGYYGASTTELMMLEIYENGPITVSFEVYSDFHTYSGGVYTHKSSNDLLSDNLPWELVNHAVCAVGWGFDPVSNLPYWIVKNSWSSDWGLEGYFWILKGSDECGIESGPVAATPVF
eukprot:TRINITY_DN389_c0_g1_i3.p1 TRINITY_DN389_c0_g1~~TRINITY_DN389_c0_g1_i3.p1  ORF type:complete len:493 (-),score=196.99 TRINITY_DN389_c0_g1_i3:104-1504(-)